MLENLLLPLLIGLAIGMWLQSQRAKRKAFDAESPAPLPGEGLQPGDPDAFEVSLFAEELAGEPAAEVVARLEVVLESAIVRLNHPELQLAHPVFTTACACLDEERFPDEEIATWIGHPHRRLSLVAASVLVERSPELAESSLFVAISNHSPWGRYILLRLVDRLYPVPEPGILETLARLDRTWLEEDNLRVLREWIGSRQSQEEPPEEEELREWLADLHPMIVMWLNQILAALGPEVGRPWREALQADPAPSTIVAPTEQEAPATESSFDPTGGDPLKKCGRLWNPRDVEELDLGVEDAHREEVAARTVRLLTRPNPRPLVVVGPPRTGKSMLVRSVMTRLLDQDWKILEATPDQVNAGMAMVGQLESRVDRLARAIRPGEQILWSVPDLTGMVWAGSVSSDAGRSIGRVMRRALEQRQVLVLGECTRAEWEHARVQAPWLTACFETVELQVPDEATTLDLVGRWLRQQSPANAPPRLDADLLREAWELTRQFLAESQRPGNLFDTVRLALEDHDHAEVDASPRALARHDLLRSVSRRTGLPLSLLDDRQALDLDQLQDFFTGRVRGQTEAVECLVDRMAMMKSGVTDPTRPLGVFLFAGPTGSGKTEMAKTLAEWLFGSPSRMIRLDMSELRTPDSLDKLLGEPSGRGSAGSSLVDRIRQEPFSVLLLDEFEKAAPEVWDLFLQVFDDGRLGDRRGRVADFRHSVILLTSNVGSQIQTRPGVGFRAAAAGFSEAKVREALRLTFRPEFLNRIDRVVVFRPLSRAIMREILQRQIELVTRRRGLRDRPWAVEFDEAALELLLDRGFSLDLGARPLQRALERYLLAPLARTMASQQAPEGDQFLFVRVVGGELAIDFVDPDAPVMAEATLAGDGERASTPVSSSPEHAALVAGIALEPRGLASELAVIDGALRTLEARIDGADWQQRRQAELEMTSLEDFWQAEDRFTVLDAFQTRERIERVVRSARRLHDRLLGPGRETVPTEPMRQLALKIHLLLAACADLDRGQPGEVLLLMQERRPASDGSPTAGFLRRLASMYRGWASRRGATLHPIELPSEAATGSWAATVQGFGVAALLTPEAGLHVYEKPAEEDRRMLRQSVRVHCAAIEAGDPRHDSVPPRVLEILRATDDLSSIAVVRRYREQPSPLVRDAVRGWRTGRLDRVLEGDFDLFASGPGSAAGSAAADGGGMFL